MKDIGLLILRVGMSLAMLIGHGYSKLLNVIKGNFEFVDPIGIGQAPTLILATLSEFVCAILIIIGFKTRLASIPMVITMFVAAFVYHLNDPFEGSKEMSILYLIGFTAIALTGAGKYSLDKN